MRLVTFQKESGSPRAGTLVDGDTRIIDLAEAHRAAFGGPGLESVLSIAEGGDAALERAREAVKKAPADASVARAEVRLRANAAAAADARLPVLRAASETGFRV